MRVWLILIAAAAGCLFAWQVYVITTLREDAAVLDVEIKRSQNLVSCENLASYARALFDGVTFGRYANDGIFTEVNRMTIRDHKLEERAVRISAKYAAAKLVRNYSLVGCSICVFLGFAWPRRKAS